MDGRKNFPGLTLLSLSNKVHWGFYAYKKLKYKVGIQKINMLKNKINPHQIFSQRVVIKQVG